jgi:protocatechuate 3,4-dioxygenase beta subunit
VRRPLETPSREGDRNLTGRRAIVCCVSVDRAGNDDDHGGLAVGLPRLYGRRRLLTLLGGGGAALIVGCSSDDAASSASTAGAGTGPASTQLAGSAAQLACSTIAEETAGPFPGDGSNGPNVLTDSAAVRNDIRSSFGAATGMADGVPLVVELVVLDTAKGCAPMAGAAVYVWHCDREGRYSLYSDGVTGENYLRGLAETDEEGRVSFLTIVPGAYPGRWPHIHFEVYPTLAAATSTAAPVATSQLALPADACTATYASTGYEASMRTFVGTTIEQDGVFGDDAGVTQLPTSEGSATTGFTMELIVPV